MSRCLNTSALAATAFLASFALADAAPQRLVSPLPPTPVANGNHTLTFEAPASSGQWYLTLEQSQGKVKARIRLNGQLVLPRRNGQPQAIRLEVPVQAGTNTLKIRQWGSGLSVRVDGVVPEADLSAPFPGQRVASLELLDETLQVSTGSWWRVRKASATYPVTVPAGPAFLTLRAQNGWPRALVGRVRWQGSAILDPASFNAWTSERLVPLAPPATGTLEATIWGRRYAKARFRVQGYLVDEQAPLVVFTQPADGATLGGSDPIAITFNDAGAGVDVSSARILLNGQDVTSSFQVTSGGATAQLSDLPAGLLTPTNTLEARVADLACNEGSAVISFLTGAAGPALSTPGDLTLECLSPAGTPLHFVTRTDAGATVACAPASGSVFPLGTTTVTCTATGPSGTTTKTFVVTVADTQGPVLGTDAYSRADTAGAAAGILLVDLNGDDRPDRVLSTSGGLTFELGLPSGGFGAAASVPTGSLSALAGADLTGDGRPEVLALEPGTAQVRVFLNDGAGNLTLGASVATGPAPSDLALADLDGDGAPDLAVSCGGDASLRTYQGAGTTFNPSAQLATGASPQAVLALDLDRDGQVDLLSADEGAAELSVFPGQGSFSFAPRVAVAVAGGPRSLTVADFDQDGWLDVATANLSGNSLALLAGGPAGLASAGPAIPLSGGPLALEAFDVNGDGEADLVVSTGVDVAVLTGGAGFTFGAANRSPSLAPAALALADLNGDGRLEIATAGSAGQTLLTSGPALPDLSPEAQGPTGTTVTYTTPLALDACGPATATCLPVSGSTLALGATTVTCTATDAAGNQSTSSFTVTVQDTTAPSLVQPQNLSFEQESPTGAVVTFALPGATDLVDPAPVVVCTPPSGSTFVPGLTTVTCVATDASGNSASVSFTVAVQDTIAPSLPALGNQSVEQTSPAGAVFAYATPTATDAADPSPSVVCTPASGGVFPPGVTTVTCTATDAAGNQSSESFTVTVQDTTGPSLSQPQNLTREQATPAGTVVTYTTPIATDPVDPNPSVACSPPSGSTFAPGVTTVTCTATDAAGNQSSVDFTITIQDTVAPALVQPAGLLAEQSNPAGAVVTYTAPAATDAADPNPTVVCVPPSGSTFAPGATTVTCTATDAAGNQSSVDFTITVQDTVSPALSVVPQDGATVAAPQPVLSADYSDSGSGLSLASFQATLDGQDVTSSFSVGASQATAQAPLLGNGSHVFVVVIADAAGNVSTQTATFTVQVADTTPPTLTIDRPAASACTGPLGTIELSYSDGESGIEISSLQVLLNGSDVSAVFSASQTQAEASLSTIASSTFLPGTNTLQVQISDVAGNTTSQSRSFEFDATPPTVTLEPADGSSVPGDATIALRVTYSDVGCGGVDPTRFRAFLDSTEVTSSFVQGPSEANATVPSPGDGPHTLTVTVVDLVGNSTQVSSTFQVVFPATGFELSLLDGGSQAIDPATVEVIEPYTLSLRAVKSDSSTATGFVGFVLLSQSDGGSPLDGLVVEFEPADQGLVQLTGLAQFRTLGPIVVTARSLEAPPADINGSQVFGVGVGQPLLEPAPPSTLGEDGAITITGYSFPGQQVELVSNGQVIATTVAGSNGEYSFSLTLPPGSNALTVQATDPDSGQLETSATSLVVVATPTVVGLALTPSPDAFLSTGQGLDAVAVHLLSNTQQVVVTGQATWSTSNASVATVTSQGRVTALAAGNATITASLGGFSADLAITSTPSSLVASSPAHLEGKVAVTRETVLTFSAPLNVATISSQAIFAEFAGQRLDARLHVSPDARRVTLFYTDPLPASARVRVSVSGDLLQDSAGNQLDGDGDLVEGGVGVVDFDTLSLTVVAGTAVCGRVFASELAPVGTGSINTPLAGVKVSVDGAEDTLFAITDSMGNFRLEPAPAGRFFVHIDGRTATIGVPAGAYYPFVGKSWVTAPGVEVNVGDVFLPLIEPGTLQAVSTTQDTAITFAPSVLADFPQLAGAEIVVPAGSLFRDDGTPGGAVGISPVAPDRLPGELPTDLNFSLVFTVQTDGATNFDQPVAVRLPNTDGLSAGTAVALWSFDHDSGQWRVSGPATVTADGQFVETDPGSGVLAPGWHAVGPGVSGTGGQPFSPGTRLYNANGQPIGVMGANGPLGPDGLPLALGTPIFGPGGAGSGQGVGGGGGDGTGGGSGSGAGGGGAGNGSGAGGNDEKETCNVSFHNGEEHFSQTDLFVPGRGDLSFNFRRTYKSRLVYNGPLGHGWSHNYHEALYADANGDVVRETGFGHVDRWISTGQGTYQAPAGYFMVLRRLDEGGWVLRSPNGMKRYFFASGRLRALEDRHGNRMLFDYNRLGLLDTVIDVYGREYTLEWEVAPDQFVRIRRLRDFAGREVVYTYDQLGDLVEVRSPIVVGTSTGNDFPNGRSERYTYSSGFADERLNHNILSRTLPEEVAAGGPPAFEWTYGTDPSLASFDRVVRRTRGGTNASGVLAGGEMALAYQELNQAAPAGNLALARLRVTHTDRSSNVTEYDFNELTFAIAKREFTRGLRPGDPAFFEEVRTFNSDGQRLSVTYNEQNRVEFTYQGGGRLGAGNLLAVRRIAGPRGGGEDLVTTFTYEPLYNRIASMTDPRGNAQGYVAPIGTVSAARYTSRVFYDYQEHTDPVEQAIEFEIDLSAVPRGLGDLNDDGRTDQSAGNPVRSEAPTVTLHAGGPLSQRLMSATQEVVSQSQWNDSGQLTAAIDPEGNVTRTEYHLENDPDGDGITVFSPYTDVTGASTTGYLQALTVDAEGSPRRTTTTPPAALRSEVRYDTVGNVVLSRNPRGIETHFEVTALNETIVVKRGANVAEAIFQGELPIRTTPFAYLTRMTRDHNGRVTRTEVENRDGNTTGVGAFVEQTRVFDILNDVVSSSVELNASTTLTTQYRYDANQNLTEVTLPEGNRVRVIFDERDFPFTITRGFGTPEASTTQRDYDLNGNPVRLTDAEDNDGDAQPESTALAYDGFDRLLSATDALGNRSVSQYDVAGNLVRIQAFGHPAGQPGTPNVLLSDAEVVHDELNRAVLSRRRLFVSSGFATARPPQLLDGDSDGWAQTVVEFDSLSRPVFMIEDDGEVSETVYDGVSRPIESIDALGNRSLTAYDRNSNAISSTSVETSPEGLVPAEVFTTRYVYDQLDRLVRATDNAGQTSYFAYDSRDNLVRQQDPEGPVTADPLGVFPGQINGPGNSKTYVYDGLSRMIRQVCDLRVGGTGAGALDTSNPFNPDGQISLSYEFDGNSRLTGIVDDNGNRTRNRYDALDRRITHIYAIDQADTGGRRERFDYVFDRDSNVRQVTDPNGTVVTKSFDALNRMTATSVARAAGVGGTTTETFEYDGLSRLTRCTDDNGSLTTVQTAEKVYDSLSRLIEERQNGQAVSNVFTGDSKRLQCTYPGGRVIRNTFDAIDRVKTINDATGTVTQIAATDWIGPGLRELRRLNANGTKLTFLNDAENADLGYDAVQRITRLRVLAPGGASAVVDREYGYNRASVRTSEKRNDDFGLTDSYSYDSMYRVVSTALDANGLAGATPRATQQLGYTLDGVGNRRKVNETTGSGTTTEDYAVNQVNQYTTKGGVARSHSRNGNLLGDGTRTYVYDYKNRLTQVARATDGVPIADYLYHCDNRRSVKVVYSATQPGVVEKETRFFYDGWQVCEDQSGAGASELTYVYSPVYIDEPVQLRREAAHPFGPGVLYTHQNARADVVSVTDAAGAVVEQRFFDDFGKTYDEIKALAGASAVGNPYGFQGRRFDSETGLYYFRNRFYDPEAGRFLQRDPVWDAGNVGGQYSFAGNGPASDRDPSGLQGWGSLNDERAKKVFREHPEIAKGMGDAILAQQQRSFDLEPLDEMREELVTAKKAAHAEWCTGSKVAAVAIGVGMAAIVIDKISDLSPKGLFKKAAKEGGGKLIKEGAEALGKKGVKTFDDFMAEGAERLGKKAKELGPSGSVVPGQSTLQKNLGNQMGNLDKRLQELRRQVAANPGNPELSKRYLEQMRRHGQPVPPGMEQKLRAAGLQNLGNHIENRRNDVLNSSAGPRGELSDAARAKARSLNRLLRDVAEASE